MCCKRDVSLYAIITAFSNRTVCYIILPAPICYIYGTSHKSEYERQQMGGICKWNATCKCQHSGAFTCSMYNEVLIIIPWRKLFLKKVIAVQVFKKFSVLYEVTRFIVMFLTVHQLKPILREINSVHVCTHYFLMIHFIILFTSL